MRNALTAVIAALVLLASCGLPTDTEPREYTLDEIPTELWPGQLPTPTPEGTAGTGDKGRDQIHMLSPGNQLERVEREIAETPEELLRVLLNGTTPEEAANGITSALNNRTTRIQGIVVDDVFRLATVDLAPGSLDSRNSEQKLAFAQIVFTLTALPDIEQVTFVQSDPETAGTRGPAPEVNAQGQLQCELEFALIDGECIVEPTALAVQTDSGTTLPGRRVTRTDFELVRPREPGEQASIGFDIPIDAAPTEVPEPDPTATPEPESSLRLWFVNLEDELQSFVLVSPESPAGRLNMLFAGAPLAAQDRDLRSSLPPDALANAVVVTQVTLAQSQAPPGEGATDEVVDDEGAIGIALVQLAPASLPPLDDGSEHDLALAQIVYTLTEVPGIEQVIVSVNGVQEGDAGYTRSDFSSFDPNSTPTDSAADADETPADESEPIAEPTPDN